MTDDVGSVQFCSFGVDGGPGNVFLEGVGDQVQLSDLVARDTEGNDNFAFVVRHGASFWVEDLWLRRSCRAGVVCITLFGRCQPGFGCWGGRLSVGGVGGGRSMVGLREGGAAEVSGFSRAGDFGWLVKSEGLGREGLRSLPPRCLLS